MDDRLKSKATNERVKGRIAEVDNEGERRERKERKEVDGPSATLHRCCNDLSAACNKRIVGKQGFKDRMIEERDLHRRNTMVAINQN